MEKKNNANINPAKVSANLIQFSRVALAVISAFHSS